MPCSASCWWTRSGVAFSLSILLIATMIGTLAARAGWIASIVLGVTLSLCRLDRHHVLARHRLDREAELVGDDLRRREVDDLVDRGQDLRSHQLLDHLDRADAKLLREVFYGQRRRQDGAAVAVGLDLGHDRGGLEGGARSLDRAWRQGRGCIAGQPPL